ncbi:hypothetical protein HanIR_Chr12g0563411 [Helianthus annuus]|nr:hypothetical protein HanIR_Chr12g0563411 [Helianthus annuus]
MNIQVSSSTELFRSCITSLIRRVYAQEYLKDLLQKVMILKWQLTLFKITRTKYANSQRLFLNVKN